MQSPPSYIQASGVLELPSDFPWKGKGMHYGPPQGTKLHDALGMMTACAITTLSVLAAEWLVWRLRNVVHTERYLDYLASALAWEVDPRYRDEGGTVAAIPNDSPVNQAIGDALTMIKHITEDRIWEYPVVSVPSAATLVNIVKQTLPAKPKKAFTAWLDAAIARAAKVAPHPGRERPNHLDFGDREEFKAALRPYFGEPLPREALDPDFDYRPEQREELLSKFLQGLDFGKNPFLRSPDKMRELGFMGTAYRLE